MTVVVDEVDATIPPLDVEYLRQPSSVTTTAQSSAPGEENSKKSNPSSDPSSSESL